MMHPRRDRTRQIVDTDGVQPRPFEVERDRLGAAVMAQLLQLLAHGNDLVLYSHRDPLRTPMRPAGPRLQPGLALSQEPLHQDLNPARHP